MTTISKLVNRLADFVTAFYMRFLFATERRPDVTGMEKLKRTFRLWILSAVEAAIFVLCVFQMLIDRTIRWTQQNGR